jgi:hypothetical protein
LVGLKNGALQVNDSVSGRKSEASSGTYQEFFLFFLRRLVVESTGLDDLVVDIELETCTRIHGFLHTLLCDEAKDADRFGLADTMRPVLCLQICMRVPER